MREFYFTFKEGLKSGLRTREDNPRNEQDLVECFNLKASEKSPLPYSPLTLPSYTLNGNPADLTIDWPFPQVIGMREYSLLVLRDSVINIWDRVYQIESDGSLTLIATIDALTYGALGDQFDFADFGTYAFGTNGVAQIYYDPTLLAWQVITSSSTIPMMKTVCNFKGQAVGGNIQSSWHECGENHVVWSAIGNMDFTPGRANVEGYMKMPWDGEVLRVMRLGDYVMVYGSNGIVALNPTIDPVPSFGLEEMLDVGIPNKEAVGGDINSHTFIDNAGYLWKIGRSLDVAKLGIGTSYPSAKRSGYKEFLSALDTPVISYQPEEQEYYIADADKGYFLTAWGMSEIHQMISSMGRVNGSLVGVFEDSEDIECRVTTDTIDLGLRGQKTTQTIEVGIYTTGVVRSSVDWRNDIGGAFQTAPWILVNPSGFSTNVVAGVEFRLKIKVDDYTDVELDQIIARYKMTDMRSIRGIYAPAPRGQT